MKARDVARGIQGMPVSQAIDVLTFTPRKAAVILNKTLKSAVANAENNHELDVESLVVKEATVTKGPSFRRFKPRARGSAAPIRKPTSHINIVLTDEIEIPEPRKRSGKKGRKLRPLTLGAAAMASEPEEEVIETGGLADEAPAAVDETTEPDREA